MTEEPISLSAARASKAGDGRLWTPLDCLRDTIKEIENGRWSDVELMYIAMTRRMEKNLFRFPYNCAGGGRNQMMGLLAQHMHDLASE